MRIFSKIGEYHGLEQQSFHTLCQILVKQPYKSILATQNYAALLNSEQTKSS